MKIFNSKRSLSLMIILITLFYLPCLNAQELLSNASPSTNTSKNMKPHNEAYAHKEIERKNIEEKKNAKEKLVDEAVIVIDETKKAIDFIKQGNKEDALAAIERATGKTDILIARHPEDALLPVDYAVEIIDTAAKDLIKIRKIILASQVALENKDYPEARLLLNMLRSEINVHTYHLPLAAYPNFLKEAASLLDQSKTDESNKLLVNALNTLIDIIKVHPLPIINAEGMIKDAEDNVEKDQDKALSLIANARQELLRAKELGYAGKAPEYASLDKSMNDLEKRIKSKSNSTSIFLEIKNKLKEFLKRQTETKKHS
jgi:hypothetical protein